MTREEQIDQAWFLNACQSTHCYDEKSFKEAVEWADNHPDKNKVYTKQELRDMGFGFDLNGNIVTPQEIEERSKKYIKYRKDKWVKKACEWLKLNTNWDDEWDEMGRNMNYGKIEEFRKAMENSYE